MFNSLQPNPSELIFSHGDLNPLNVLIVGNQVRLIDFEYSGYYPVGFDIAQLLSERPFDYNVDHHPYFAIVKEDAADHSLIKQFLTRYGGDEVLHFDIYK